MNCFTVKYDQNSVSSYEYNLITNVSLTVLKRALVGKVTSRKQFTVYNKQLFTVSPIFDLGRSTGLWGWGRADVAV